MQIIHNFSTQMCLGNLCYHFDQLLHAHIVHPPSKPQLDYYSRGKDLSIKCGSTLNTIWTSRNLEPRNKWGLVDGKLLRGNMRSKGDFG